MISAGFQDQILGLFLMVWTNLVHNENELDIYSNYFIQNNVESFIACLVVEGKK